MKTYLSILLLSSVGCSAMHAGLFVQNTTDRDFQITYATQTDVHQTELPPSGTPTKIGTPKTIHFVHYAPVYLQNTQPQPRTGNTKSPDLDIHPEPDTPMHKGADYHTTSPAFITGPITPESDLKGDIDLLYGKPNMPITPQPGKPHAPTSRETQTIKQNEFSRYTIAYIVLHKHNLTSSPYEFPRYTHTLETDASPAEIPCAFSSHMKS